MNKYLLVVLTVILCQGAMAAKSKKDDGSEIQRSNSYPQVKILTSMGDIVVELNRYKAPMTVNNFLRYVKKRSYEGTVFHRIVPDFVVQGGGYDEKLKRKPAYSAIFNESGNGVKNNLYTVAMARENKPHTATRQFFFNMNDNDSLNPGRNWGYAVFGEVLEGSEILDAMAQVETHIDSETGWGDVPIKPIVINKVEILPQKK